MHNIKKNYNPDVLTCLANLSNDEVFTPPKIVNKMLDMLPQSLFTSKDTTFLDPSCKSGVFLREIAKRLVNGLAKEIPDIQERLNHIFTKQLYGFAITELTALLSRRSLYCSRKSNGKYSVCNYFNDENGNIIFNTIQHKWKNGSCSFCGASEVEYSRDSNLETYAYQFIHAEKNEEIFKMKFDVIIGNPPYQLKDGGAQASAKPIYNLFIEQAKKMQPHYLCMITPSRWFAGGKGLDSFRQEMLKDNSIKEIHDYPSASDVFPGVEIKGGVNYFLWEKNYSGSCIFKTYENNKCTSSMERTQLGIEYDGANKILVRYNQAMSILEKVKKFKEKSFKELVSSQKPFGLRTYIKGSKEKIGIKNIKLYQNGGIGYIDKDSIEKNKGWIPQHKVIVPRAIGTGNAKTDKVNPIYSAPNSCCTETYLVIGPFESKIYCENVISYIQTKFFHFFLTLLKNTQDAPSRVYSFIPQQNFNEVWTDEKLYKKYNLTKDEINYIESMIRPMTKDENNE